MIVANLRQSYRDVLQGIRDIEDATMGWWAGITDDAARQYGDTIVGIYGNNVVSVFDSTGFDRDSDGRVFFNGSESAEFRWMIGQKSPVKPWVRGQARPLQYIETDIVRHGDAPVFDIDSSHRRAVVKGYVLTVDQDGIAVVEPPLGGVVTVLAAGSSALPID